MKKKKIIIMLILILVSFVYFNSQENINKKQLSTTVEVKNVNNDLIVIDDIDVKSIDEIKDNNVTDKNVTDINYENRLLTLINNKNFKDLTNILDKLMNNKTITADKKTYLLWEIMSENREVFELFTNYLYELKPHLVIDELLEVYSQENSLKDKLNSFILIEKSLETVSLNKKEELYENINDYAYENIFNTNLDEELLRENLKLYSLTLKDQVEFFNLIKKIPINNYSNEAKLSIYEVWTDIIESSKDTTTLNFLIKSIENQKLSKEDTDTLILVLTSKELPKNDKLKEFILKEQSFEVSKDNSYSPDELSNYLKTSKKIISSSKEMNIFYNDVITKYKDNPTVLTDIFLQSNMESIHITNEDLKQELISNYTTLKESSSDKSFIDSIDKILDVLNQ